ncbi:MAG: I78 family peptidase inhibitor [Paracoccaceae bacterium]
MRLNRPLAFLALIFGAGSGCSLGQPAPMPTEPTPPNPVLGPSCGAEDLQDLLGLPAERLATMKFAAPTRILRPGMAVTMDFVPERLNIVIGEDGLIEAVRCG